ncbi:MAG: rod shape-determining protein MreC [Candidatus Cloacimonadales bacterium]
MLKKNGLFIFLLILTLFFQAGNDESRLRKANFVSNFVYYPFIQSLNSIYELFELKEQAAHLAERLALKQVENAKLYNALDEQKKLDVEFAALSSEFVLAKIIAYRGNFQEKNLIINKGTNDGIRKDYPVISSYGVVGKITLATDNYSIVLPIDHSAFQLGVMLKRNSLQGLLKADIYGNIAMTMLHQGADINVGDTLISSDLSDIFPKGFPVGVVTSLQRANTGVNMLAQIEPFEKINQLDQVVVIKHIKENNYEREIYRD